MILVIIDLAIKSSTASKSISMGLEEWAMVYEMAKKYHQDTFSKVVRIAVRKAYNTYKAEISNSPKK